MRTVILNGDDCLRCLLYGIALTPTVMFCLFSGSVNRVGWRRALEMYGVWFWLSLATDVAFICSMLLVMLHVALELLFS